MTGKTKSDASGESWLVEILLPGVFTLVLLGCLAHLAYCVFQAQAEHTCQAQYAISAFAN